LLKKADILPLVGYFARRFKVELTIMELLTYIYFLLPVLIAFIALWYLDSALMQKFDNSFLINVIEVFVAMLIIAIGERTVFYFLFSQ
jgi:Mn2+/Fe2+ NRAMP family transporter